MKNPTPINLKTLDRDTLLEAFKLSDMAIRIAESDLPEPTKNVYMKLMQESFYDGETLIINLHNIMTKRLHGDDQ